MAREVGLSHNAIKRIWQTFGLQPHREKTFKLSSDPFFVEKVRDIVALASTLRNRPAPLCFAWMRKARSKLWNAASLFCR